MQNRSVAAVIILTLITCGIYGLYWVYVTATALEAEGQSGSSLSPLVLLLLTLFVPNVGYLLFGLAEDDNLRSIQTQRGLPTTDNKIAYMLLGFFVPIILLAIVQNEINKMVPKA